VLANGDVDSPDKALAVLERTGADALMIGRAAQGNPWIFREIATRLRHGTVLAPPSVAETRSVLLEHVAALHAFYGEPAGVRIARKHLGWYAKGRPGNDAFRAVVNRAETAAEQLDLTRAYFDTLDAGAGRVLAQRGWSGVAEPPPLTAEARGAAERVGAAGTPP
jgi:tRNA-dihydrouridine synthase B